MPANRRSEPTDAERRSFGDLAEDVAYLRQICGLLVAPFKGGFRVNTEVLDEEGLRARAQRERIRRKHDQRAKALPAPVPVQSAPVVAPAQAPMLAKPDIIGLDRAETCGCGRSLNHYGRCWVRRGQPSPEGRAGQKTVEERLDELEAEVAKLRDQVGRAMVSR